jgi:hypothetical protein
MKNGSQYSGLISPEQYQIIQEWQSDGHNIEPPPSKRASDASTMAFQDHPLFKVPQNKETSVWRYMNFDQFISLLNTQALWFSRGHIFQKNEPYEGRLPLPNTNMDSDVLLKKLYGTNINIPPEKKEEFIRSHGAIERSVLYNTLINCWNLGEHESNAMWKVYGKTNNCVAIKSTVNRLINSYGAYSDYDVYMGEVEYIDHQFDEINLRIPRSFGHPVHAHSAPDSISINPDNYFRVWLQKVKFYESERELRCIITDDGETRLFPDTEPHISPINLNEGEVNKLSPGVCVPIVLNNLISKIYIGPQADKWFETTVRTTLEKYGLTNVEVVPSFLTKFPEA